MWNLDETIDGYKSQGAPGDQSALISLLKEIQQESGGRIPGYMLKTVAESCGIKESFLLALIKRIPSLRLADVHCLEVCCGPNCGKNRAIAACAEKLCAASGGKFELKFVNCMRMCGKGPNIKWDGKLYHKATEALLEELTGTI